MPVCACWWEESTREGPSCVRRPFLPHGRPTAAVAIVGAVMLLRPLQARARIEGEKAILPTPLFCLCSHLRRRGFFTAVVKHAGVAPVTPWGWRRPC
jgi:hypothetical protein